MAVEAFVQLLIEKLSSLIQGERGLIWGVEKTMENLKDTLTSIQIILGDAEKKQFESRAIQRWLGQLNDVAYEIDDILDECAIEVPKLESKDYKFNSISSRLRRRMKEVAEKLDVVATNLHRVVPKSRQVDWRHKTGSVVNEADNIYGRDEEKEKIVDTLVNQAADCDQLSVLPIIGVGGLGKTTLAQLVYNDKRVSQYFDTKLWVCVSDNFDLRILLKDIIEAASGTASDSMSLFILERHLQELLNWKRYLLILDDMWNESTEIWFMLKSILACGFNGSSIVVTTRVKKVADIIGTLPTFCLKALSEEHCWFLLRQRAFGQEKPHPNLESIGRQIVKKSAGVPLAAKAVGGLLRFKREEDEWIRVKESEIWDLQEEETLILPSLGLSYLHLSSKLRQCFVYCAVFPKNCVIEKQDLIFRWIAHGYISSNRTEEVEDVGDRIWNELILKSIFQEVKTTGNETTCKMHDLVHDLAQSIMQYRVPGAQMKANSLVGASHSKIRELVYVTEHSMNTSSSIAARVSTLTTIMDHTHLRILKFESNVEELPSAIGRLKHLRYLNLSGSSIHTLPHTLCGLRNLKFLILNNCSHLKRLPKTMRCMTNLRHILLEGCSSLSHMPSRIGKLASLKTLSLFIVGDIIGNQLDELRHLNLRGRLEIKHLERVQSHISAGKANLRRKPNLRVLVLCWEGYSTSESAKLRDEMVLEALRPNRYLETLEIRGFKGRGFPLWMRKMHHVTKITIEDCPNCSHLTPLGDLPSLKSLYLRNLPALEYIDGSESKFPSLKDFTLYNLPNLKGFVKKKGEEIGGLAFQNLGSLYINSCQLLILPSLPTLEELDAWRCSLMNLCSFSSNLENLTSLRLGLDTKSTNEYIPGDATWEGPCNLKELFIWNAEEFCFPEKWFRGLKHLQVLVIDQCNIGVVFQTGGWGI